MQNLTGLSGGAPQYGGMPVDVYGVVHTGEACFTDAINWLHALADTGISYAFLFNIPRLGNAVFNAQNAHPDFGLKRSVW